MTPVHTPWGPAQTVREIAPGITFYSTASHGGFHLSPERIAEMPEPLQKFQPWAEPGWYEEDCDWAVVALAFPQFFKPEDMPSALATIKGYKPNLYAEIIERGIA